jgi:hypothetical protein
MEVGVDLKLGEAIGGYSVNERSSDTSKCMRFASTCASNTPKR